MKWLFEKDNIVRETVGIETQMPLNNRYPDILVKAGDTENKSYVAIIESKIDSCEGKNQLNAYEEILLTNWPSATSRNLIYLTKYNEEIQREQSDNLTFMNRNWSDVYNTFATAMKASSEQIGALECELLKLMEDWDMDGNINVAHLRSYTICFSEKVGEKLRKTQNDAWADSGIGKFLHDKFSGKWSYGYETGEQTSPEIRPYGAKIWMGFRVDRRDEVWNVDHLEFPSPAVTLDLYGTIDQELPKSPQNWTKGNEIWPDSPWVREPTAEEMLNFGEPLNGYYKDFFLKAFFEIQEVLESDK